MTSKAPNDQSAGPAGHVDSYYAATALGITDHDSLRGAQRFDVCVIGAGYTGLSTALELAERGYKVAVLEARRVGWGASGRNGGQICTGFSSGMAKVERWVGRDDARKLFQVAEEAKRIIIDRVERYAIDCDLTWGYFHGASKPRHLSELAEDQTLLSRHYGYEDTRLVEGNEAVREYVNTPSYVGGLYEEGAGHLHPLNYCLGLARAAVAAGVRIFEQSEVTGLSFAEGRRPRATTAGGSVEAEFLVLAGNAYLGELVPSLRHKIMPVGTYIAASEVLGQNRARGVIPSGVAVADCNFVLNYYRLSSDDRLLFGGRVSYSTLMPPNLPHAMRGKMLQVFPDLADVGFDYTWGGFVGITMERTPHLGRLAGNVFFAQGFSGQGVAMTGVSGRILAEAIAGQAERLDLMAKLPHTTFPGGRLFRTPSLAFAMLWYRLRDML